MLRKINRSKLLDDSLWCRIQAGQYEDAHVLLNDLLKLEEESLGARTDKLADIYQLMSKTKSEVMHNTFSQKPWRKVMRKEIARLMLCKGKLRVVWSLTQRMCNVSRFVGKLTVMSEWYLSWRRDRVTYSHGGVNIAWRIFVIDCVTYACLEGLND